MMIRTIRSGILFIILLNSFPTGHTAVKLSFIPNTQIHYIGSNITVECKVEKSHLQFSVELFCPLQKEACFQNCLKMCKTCSIHISQAECKENSFSDSRSMKYTFYNMSTEFADMSGFMCKVGNKVSSRKAIELIKRIVTSPTTSQPLRTKSKILPKLTEKDEPIEVTKLYRPVQQRFVPDSTEKLCTEATPHRIFIAGNEIYLFLSENLDGRIFVCIVGLLIGSTILMLLCCLRCFLIRKCAKGKGRIFCGGLCCMKKEVIALRQMRQRTVGATMQPFATDFYSKKILNMGNNYGDASDQDRESSYMVPHGLSSVSEVGIPPVKKSDTFSHYSEGMNYMGNQPRHVIGASFSEVGHESGQRTLNRSLPQGLQLMQLVSPPGNSTGNQQYQHPVVLMSMPIPEQQFQSGAPLPTSKSADNNTIIRNNSGKLSQSSSDNKLQNGQQDNVYAMHKEATGEVPANTVLIPYSAMSMMQQGQSDSFYYPLTSMYMPAANLSQINQSNKTEDDQSLLNNKTDVVINESQRMT